MATQAVVAPTWGGNVIALSVQVVDWAWPVPVLEAVDLATLAAKPTSFGMPLLAPTPGRVGTNQSGVCRYGGQEYRLQPARHGFVRDLPWNVAHGTTDRLTCTVEVDPDQQDRGFPFRFDAQHEVVLLQGALRSRVRLENTSERTQPLNVGWHPYLHRDEGECRVRIPAGGRWELDDRPEPTPTGRIAAVGREDDFRGGRKLTEDEHWDDVFTDLDTEGGGALCWTEQSVRVRTVQGTDEVLRLRRYVRLDTTAGGSHARALPHVQLYTPPGRRAISIEPLSAPPDALNLLARGHPRADVCELSPGDSAEFEITVGLQVVAA